MWTGPHVALPLQLALAATAGLLAPRAKLVAVALGAACFLGAPWLAGSVPAVRGLDALVGGVVLFRIIDLVREDAAWGARRRLLHALSFVDSRTLRAEPRALDVRALARGAAWDLVAAAGFYVAHAPNQLVRWAGGMVFVYAAIEAGYAFIGAGYRALGFVTPPLHVLPLVSPSVTELWGKRWARPESAWLRETCFEPLQRRGHPKAGLLLAFGASGMWHAYPVFVATGLPLAVMMLAFFFVQSAFVVTEGLLGSARWPRPARHVLTIALMVASSPLFVEPTLCAFGVPA
jgi:hypothetical protein